jgi:hypothetical protein
MVRKFIRKMTPTWQLESKDATPLQVSDVHVRLKDVRRGQPALLC